MGGCGPGAANSRATINWNGKMIIWVDFSRSGAGSVAALPEKETFTRRLFVEKVLNDFGKERVEAPPKKRARGTFLYLDNMPAGRAYNDFNRLVIRRLFHPSYAPDLAPCDFWLFGNLKTKLEGKSFPSAMERMAKVNQILMDIPLREFISVFDQWMRRVVECIDTGGDYLSKDQSRWLALVSLAKTHHAIGLSAASVDGKYGPASGHAGNIDFDILLALDLRNMKIGKVLHIADGNWRNYPDARHCLVKKYMPQPHALRYRVCLSWYYISTIDSLQKAQ
jgi:hypothetical protein